MAASSPARFLLLIPADEGHTSLPSIKTAFGSTLLDVLKEVSLHSQESKDAAVLEIAVSCGHLLDRRSSRQELSQSVQRFAAAFYKSVVVIAAHNSINVEDQSGVDVRIILLDWRPGHEGSVMRETSFGPVIGLQALAKSSRPWQHALGVESDRGAAMIRAFLTARQEETIGQTQVNHEMSGPRCYDVAVGGTFDHLHIGHKLLLLMTLFAVDEDDTPRSVTIGITGDELLKKKKYAEVLESWDDRQKAVEEFCDSILDFSQWPSTKQVSRKNEPGPNGKSVDLHYSNGLVVKCTEIQDPFGPTITEERISALVISGETRSGGNAVNDKRKEKGWSALNVLEVDVLDAEEDGVTKEGFDAKLSSTAIRQKLASKS